MRALGQRKKQLEVEYASLCMQLGILGEPDTVNERIEEEQNKVTAFEQSWQQERETLLAQADAIKEECSQI